MTSFGTISKAIFAAVTTFVSGLITALSSNTGLADITTQQWLVVGLATIVAFGGVYGLTNSPPAASKP